MDAMIDRLKNSASQIRFATNELKGAMAYAARVAVTTNDPSTMLHSAEFTVDAGGKVASTRADLVLARAVMRECHACAKLVGISDIRFEEVTGLSSITYGIKQV